MSPVQPFIANSSPGRLLLLCLLSLGFVAIGVWLALEGPGNPEHFVVGILCILFFGMTTIGIFVRVMRTGPEVRIDGNGIWVRRTSHNTIPWSAIRAISVAKVRSQRFLCLDLIDPASFSGGGVLGGLAGVNTSLGFGDVSISVTGTDRGFDDLIAAVREFAPPALRL